MARDALRSTLSGRRSRSPPSASRSRRAPRPDRWRGSPRGPTPRSPQLPRPGRWSRCPAAAASSATSSASAACRCFGAEAGRRRGPATAAPMLVADSTVAGLDPRRRRRARSRARRRSPRPRDAGGVQAPARPGESPSSASTRAPARLAWRGHAAVREPARRLRLVPVDARSGEKLRVARPAAPRDRHRRDLQPEPGRRAGRLLGPARTARTRTTPLLDLAAPAGDARSGSRAARAASRAPTSTPASAKKGKKVCEPALDFTALTRSDNAFEAVMAYFHIDRTRAYVDSLGLSQPLRSKPQKVFANAITDDNSFYSPSTHELVLGTGGVDDGEDADVIVHEYGHSLQDQASPELAAQARGRRRWARASATTWPAAMSGAARPAAARSTPASSTGTGSPTRPAAPAAGARTAAYDVEEGRAASASKEIHCVGEVWSSTLFDLRTALGNDPQGRSIMDRVVARVELHARPGSRTSRDGAPAP